MTLDSSAAKSVERRDVSFAQSQLISELAKMPARKGLAIANDLLRNRAEAEEAVQEALVRACESIADLRDPAAAQAWFLRIVTTQCLRTLRRRRLRQALFGWGRRVDEVGESDGGGTDHGGLQRHSHAAGDQSVLAAQMHAVDATVQSDIALLAHNDRAALLANVALLPGKQRAAIVLRYGHEMSVPEVANTLDVSVATAKTHLVRGLEKLRELLEDSV
jgi:RNA polymerase sigma-70 factor, ECF subfamily